jgi:hypothetical protein
MSQRVAPYLWRDLFLLYQSAHSSKTLPGNETDTPASDDEYAKDQRQSHRRA